MLSVKAGSSCAGNCRGSNANDIKRMVFMFFLLGSIAKQLPKRLNPANAAIMTYSVENTPPVRLELGKFPQVQGFVEKNKLIGKKVMHT